MTPQAVLVKDDILANHQQAIKEYYDLSPEDLTNSLNCVLLEPLEEHRLDDSLVPVP